MWSSSDCTISLCPSVLGNTLPHAHPPLSQMDKSLGPKCMRDTWISSSAELLIEIPGHCMYLLDPYIFILLVGIFCVTVVTEFHEISTVSGGRGRKTTESLYLSPHLISQDKTISILVVLHAKEMCLDVLLIRCEFISKVKWEKGVGIQSWLHFLKGCRWSRKFEPSPCGPPGFYSGHFSDLPEKVSCCKMALKKLMSFSKK